jgi:HEXXH motif-containing protein
LIKTHRLPVAHFAALAAGHGDAETVRLLKGAELSKRILQIRALLDCRHAETERAFNLLTDVQRRAPGTVADVLCYPQIGAWAASCLRRIRAAADADGTLDLDVAHLGAIAAVAAIRAKVEIAVPVPVRDGVVALPSLGCAEVGPAALTGMAVVRCRTGGEAEVEAGDRQVVVPRNPECDARGWRGLRRIRSRQNGYTLEVCIDDLDPYRGGHGLRPACRLTPSEIAGWQRTLDGAWTILAHHHRERATAITAGLTAVIPLAHQGGNHGVSATATDAFGAMAMSPPADPLLFAETLVHEFQHAKLGALLKLVPLYDTGGDERYYAPWRDDPRPLGGLLQGVYAYFGVTDFWRRQLHIAADNAPADVGASFAAFQFALWRGQTLRAISSLTASDRLTTLGTRFAEGMRATLASWRDVPVPADARELADEAAIDHALLWRLCHVQPNHDAVDRLGRAWLDGARCPQVAMSETTAAGQRPGASDARSDLRLRWIRSSRRSRRPGDAELDAELGAGIEGVTAADIAYVQRDYHAALRGYRARMAVDPESVADWAGLALALRHVAPGPAADLLSTCPELVAAVHRRVRELAGSPDPEELAAWLAAGRND